MSLLVHIKRNPSTDWQFPFGRGELRRIVAVMGDAVDVEQGEVEIRLMTDAEMARLHTDALGLPGPTNVLAFPESASPVSGTVRTGEAKAPSLGSLAISPETLRRECLLYGQEPEKHALRLLAHGLAHLLGHDHGSAMEAVCRRMEEAALTACA
jgi:probable rRNA maturation factor